MDRILVDVRFAKDIPEWLPILSCKARIYYPGINRQCYKCYETGHQGWSCKNPQLTWKEYCKRLFMIGVFPKEIFGHWLPESDEAPEEDRSKKTKSQVDLRNFLNEPAALKELASFFKSMSEGSDNNTNQRKKIYRGQRKPRN